MPEFPGTGGAGRVLLLAAAMVAGLALPHAGAANIAMNASNAIGFSGFNSGTGWTGGVG